MDYILINNENLSIKKISLIINKFYNKNIDYFALVKKIKSIVKNGMITIKLEILLITNQNLILKRF